MVKIIIDDCITYNLNDSQFKNNTTEWITKAINENIEWIVFVDDYDSKIFINLNNVKTIKVIE